MVKRKTERSKFIKRFLEHRECEDYKFALGRKNKGQGVYVLYKGNKIYYIGLSKRNLKGRLKRHYLKNRHKGNWTNFSFYQIGRSKFIKDVESLLLRICNPPGNRVSGRFIKRYDLSRRIEQQRKPR
jgi:hypothetical protein